MPKNRNEGRNREQARQDGPPFNPLTGNRMFFTDLRDGDRPDEVRTVKPPVHEGAGRIFKPRREDAEK